MIILLISYFLLFCMVLHVHIFKYLLPLGFSKQPFFFLCLYSLLNSWCTATNSGLRAHTFQNLASAMLLFCSRYLSNFKSSNYIASQIYQLKFLKNNEKHLTSLLYVLETQKFIMNNIRNCQMMYIKEKYLR